MCVVLVYFLNLRMPIFKKNHIGQYIDDFVNKTSHDKGGTCANEKRKPCNAISSDITLGRNYPFAGYKLNITETNLIIYSLSKYPTKIHQH